MTKTNRKEILRILDRIDEYKKIIDINTKKLRESLE